MLKCLEKSRNSHRDGSDFIGSNAAEAVDDADPSKEADDCSCWVTAAAASVMGVCRAEVAASKMKPQEESVKIMFRSKACTICFLFCNRPCIVWLAAGTAVVGRAGLDAAAGGALGIWKAEKKRMQTRQQRLSGCVEGACAALRGVCLSIIHLNCPVFCCNLL